MNVLQQQLTDAHKEFSIANGEPRFAVVLILFNGEKKVENQTICILRENEKGVDTESFDFDDEIFFYVKDFDELISLCLPNNGEDFVIVDFVVFYNEL